MILIADSGSTKALWTVIQNNKVLLSISTQGINPYTMDKNQIESVIANELVPNLNAETIRNVFYYGAGCSEVDKCQLVSVPLHNYFTNAAIEVQHDLLAAARSICGSAPGIACILGTGSNSCSYDGHTILKNSRALGYILGDEGSGAFMGKKLLTDYLNEDLSPMLSKKLESTYKISPALILDQVYKQANPNTYLASFAKFILENKDQEYFKDLIYSSINKFFTQHIFKYSDYKTMPIHFVGSIAFYFQETIDEIIKEHSLQKGVVIKDPIEGLIKYHCK